MFKCAQCGKWTAEYDYDQKAFVCQDQQCGHKERVQGRKERCFKCRAEYTEYTWFDPSGCSHCRKSFVS